MKAMHFKGKAGGRKVLRLGLAAAACSLPAPSFAGVTEEPSEPFVEEPEPTANWIELTVGGAFVDGNDAAFSRRHQNNGDFFGGISSFHFEHFGDKGLFEADGHAMFGLEDYEIDLKYTMDDIGFIRAGFKQFRTWYDGSGGYIPGAAPAPNYLGGLTNWGPGGLDPITPFDDELELDRGALWFEAGLRIPDIPEITFGWERTWRDGYKDSTYWYRGDRGVNAWPGLYRIDEVRDVFKLDVSHTVGNTDFGGGLRYHSVRNDNNLFERYNNRSDGLDYLSNQRQINEYDLWGGHLYSTSRFCDDKVMLSFGYNLTTLDSDIGGYSTVNHAYNNLMGGGQSTTSVINTSLWWNPVEDLVLVPSIRYEWWQQDMWGGHLSGGDEILDHSQYESDEATAEIEVRYSGIDSALLYARAMYADRSGDMFRTTLENAVVDGTRVTDADTDIQKYVIGANWYPAAGISLAAQAYYKSYDQEFNHIVTGGEDAQLAGHETETADFNVRMTWRCLPCLTFVTRYDYQQTDIENRAWTNPIPIQSADITKHIVTESVSWTPIDRLYMTLGVHWISSTTDTPADLAVPGVVGDWDNDYWSASFNGGYAFSPDTQLSWGYYFYQADNYDWAAMPYGFIGDEHVLSVGLDHRLTENMVMNVRYGYLKGDDDAAGGFNDYDAHVVSTGIRIGF